MIFWKLCSLLTVALLSLSSFIDVSNAQTTSTCTAPRVRRSWSSLSRGDRTLYLDAVAASMTSGAYIKFVEIHTEMMSEMEAHRQCMFIYWHRLLLTAFENMLRGQAARFACVTVPYWDWITDFNKFASGRCRNILQCSPALKFLGGAPPRRRKTVNINGEVVNGFCEADAPMNRFCQNSRVTGRQCAKCIPRENWSRVTFPASASFASVRAQLFGAANIGEMSIAIEEGAHNNIHAELGGTMATFASPADPVFWSHHAMVDLLHSVFHKCKVGEQKQTLAQKAASVDWTSCERREANGQVFNPYDYVMMRTGYLGQNAINATRDATIGRFFASVPQQFVALTDTRDLGASSYSYQLQGLLGTLYTQCGATTTTTSGVRQLTEQNQQKQSAPATTAPLCASTSHSETDTGMAEEPVVAAEADETTPSGAGPPTASTSSNATVLPPPPPMSAMINTTTETTTATMGRWLNSTDRLVKRRGGNAVPEVEKMQCLFQDECLGGVTAYTAEFKKKFGITKEPRCKRIVDRIRRKGDAVKITEWKAQMVQAFGGCPMPKTGGTTTSTPRTTTPASTGSSTSSTPCPSTTAPATTQTIAPTGPGQEVN